MKKKSRICVAILFCGSVQAFQGDRQNQSDVYTIYSLMLRQSSTSHGLNNNPIYLIRDTTVPGTPKQPCVRPPDSESIRWAEIIADFNKRQNTMRKLEPLFRIDKPFQLLSGAEGDQFVKDRMQPSPTGIPQSRAVWKGAVDLFSLGDIYFDRDQNLALTSISTWCGGLCASWQWKVFEKGADGKWVEKPWITCLTMS